MDTSLHFVEARIRFHRVQRSRIPGILTLFVMMRDALRCIGIFLCLVITEKSSYRMVWAL